MPVMQIVLTLIVIGVAMWLVNAFIPMAENIKKILNVFVTITVCVWVLKAAGVWTQVVNLRLPH